MAYRVEVAGRTRRFALEGSPRERKLRDFRRSAPCGRGRCHRVPGRGLQRDSRRLKRALARELRYELRRIARLGLLGVEAIVDTKAMKPTFAWEIV